jgi:hypothetical protein
MQLVVVSAIVVPLITGTPYFAAFDHLQQLHAL